MSRNRYSSLPSLAVATAFAAFALAPMVGLLLIALRPPGTSGGGIDLSAGLSLENFSTAWSQSGLGQALRSSGIVVLATVPLSVLLSVLAGYSFGTARLRSGKYLFVVFLLGLMIPLEALVIPLYYSLRDLGLTDTYLALILPLTALNLPFGVFWMRATFKSLPPSLEEAARLDGANSWQILWRVLLPPAMPAVFTMLVLFFMWTWNDFLLALVMTSSPGRRTAPLSITFFVGQFAADFSLIAAGSLLVAAPVMIVYVIFQRQFIGGVLSGALRE